MPRLILKEDNSRADLQTEIQRAMLERGNIGPGYKVVITSREIIGSSDWANIYIDVYEPRKRKPSYFWKLRYNFVREAIYWDSSVFDRYRY